MHVQASFGIDVIITRDKHLTKSPAPTVREPRAFLSGLRNYEKSKRRTFAIATSGWVIAFGGGITIKLLVEVVPRLIGAVARLPLPAHIVLFVLAGWVAYKTLTSENIRAAKEALRPILEQLGKEALGQALRFAEAESRAQEQLAVATADLPQRTDQVALRPALRRALLEHSKGLTVPELAAAILALGYRPEAKDFPAQVAIAVESEAGAAFADGKWRWKIMSAGSS